MLALRQERVGQISSVSRTDQQLLTDLSDSDFEGSDGEDPWEDLDVPGVGPSRRHRGSGLKRR